MTEPASASLQEFGDDFSSALCVVAHPDDIEYGTAAAVASWTAAGKTVTYFLLTRGEAGIDTMHPDQAAKVREQEERDGAAIVGVTEVEFGSHRDGVVEYGLALRRDIAREIRRRRPDVVVTGDYHDRFVAGMLNQADHRAVGLATVDAVADAGNRWIFPELLEEEGLEPWTVRRLCFAGSTTPTHFIGVGDHVEQAVASLEAHRTYNEALPETFPKPRDIVSMVLGWGGQAAGVPSAMTLDVVERR
ncbi:PIG-L deacetylase family protein [Pedococcus sp. 5OH_020]|uniref:PIG-L deacetylase family protein n=1 Tax=Pedococcus sp. 5OH_020 TaxID=2989814 RepID=UPI0022E9D9DA|nr:PIG-L deacetylase family protein [Pedococcus sp. 5OH_020]